LTLGDVTAIFNPTPDMVANFMTKQTQRLSDERHCRRAFGNQHSPIPLEPIVRARDPSGGGGGGGGGGNKIGWSVTSMIKQGIQN